ncbi:hypothetical protein BH23CHL5_BH23CHL5_09720 [soil metagenome]
MRRSMFFIPISLLSVVLVASVATHSRLQAQDTFPERIAELEAIVAEQSILIANLDERVSALESGGEGPSTVDSIADAFAGNEFSGSGDQVFSVDVQAGLLTYTATHDGVSNFVIWMYAPDGSQDLLVNEIGQYSGQRAVPIRTTGQFTISVEGDGFRTLELQQ